MILHRHLFPGGINQHGTLGISKAIQVNDFLFYHLPEYAMIQTGISNINPEVCNCVTPSLAMISADTKGS